MLPTPAGARSLHSAEGSEFSGERNICLDLGGKITAIGMDDGDSSRTDTPQSASPNGSPVPQAPSNALHSNISRPLRWGPPPKTVEHDPGQRARLPQRRSPIPSDAG